MRDNKRPTTSAFETPIYADSGFGILARVLERLTRLEYGQAIHNTLSVPLGLNAISTFKPEGDAVDGLIVPGSLAESSWGFDNQITAGSGGIYANGADLRTIGLSILHSQLLPPAATRRWMKPLGSVAALSESVGAPWEINRLALPVTSNSTRTRISDLYTKAGGQAGYGSIFALSPDHNIGFTINVAGATAGRDRWVLRDLVGETFVVAAEHAAAEYAAQNYVGTFVDDSIDGTNLTVTVDDDKPGLGLASMFWNSTEVRTALVSLQPLPIPAENVTVRLYPTGLQDGTRRVFRAVVEYYPIEPRAAIEGGQGLFNNGCTAWLSAAFYPDSDSLTLDIVDGQLESVTSVLFNSTMRRVA
ncbi:hypothetical protein LTS08_003938 [Lithohypha guttulata]|uniref:uncharacterized protein n=1 Tax=Lithohypha guttulata TaxID=1690604 RepID=UPI002DDDD11B|nr:hypothetical protein LTR51_001104 [Lithohypha guttulata]KAK5103134.1 hypothetical protein LTS08_003938 [Lithohypha guttulata]